MAPTDVDGATVRHGIDPGDYYCEHMFYCAQLEASEPGSSVLLNSSGEPLVGFLHVPSDGFLSTGRLEGYDLEARHANTRRVIGAAIRGYYDALVDQVNDKPVRILLTGYGAFMGITNNPTGEFVGQQANIDAAMQKAFGDRLASAQGELVVTSGGSDLPGETVAYRYWVKNPWTGEKREVIVAGAQFPVEDAAIDPSSNNSVQTLMRAFLPQAVISMGVAGPGSFTAEHHADSGGLRRTGDSPVHDDAVSKGLELRDNYSLVRAIQHGARLVEPSGEQSGS